MTGVYWRAMDNATLVHLDATLRQVPNEAVWKALFVGAFPSATKNKPAESGAKALDCAPDFIPMGRPLPAEAALVKMAAHPHVFLVDTGVAAPLCLRQLPALDEVFFTAKRFSLRAIKQRDQAQLLAVPIGAPVSDEPLRAPAKAVDGVFYREANGTSFVVIDQMLRKLPSEATFSKIFVFDVVGDKDHRQPLTADDDIRLGPDLPAEVQLTQQLGGDGSIYFVDAVGPQLVLRLVPDPAVFNAKRFEPKSIVFVEQLPKYPFGAPIR